MGGLRKNRRAFTAGYYRPVPIDDATTTQEIIAFCSGLLCNFPSLTNESGISPAGFRVASEVDWANLLGYLGGEAVAGGKLKSVSHWGSPNAGATNESGFAGLPSGKRSELGAFFDKGDKGYYWIKNVNV